MKRIGVFVDTSNLYYCVNKAFVNRKLDYKKYLKFVDDLGNVQLCRAYGIDSENSDSSQFEHCLKQEGYITIWKSPRDRRRASWNVGITVDILNMCDRFDLVILGSSEPNLIYMIEALKIKGIEVIVFACGIPREIKSTTKYFEIFEDLLEKEES